MTPDLATNASGGPMVAISSEEYRRLVDLWTQRRGRKTEFPRKLVPRLTALHYILRGFEQGVPYSEEHVNTIIQERNLFALDHVQLRRYLVDYGMLGRTAGGRRYQVSHTYQALARWDSLIPGVSPI